MTPTKRWRLSKTIPLSWFWTNGFYWNQRNLNKEISSNYSIGDARNLQRFFAPSMSSRNGTTNWVVMIVLWQMQSLTALLMTVIVSTLQALMPNMISRCERFMAWTKHYVNKLAYAVPASPDRRFPVCRTCGVTAQEYSPRNRKVSGVFLLSKKFNNRSKNSLTYRWWDELHIRAYLLKFIKNRKNTCSDTINIL